MSADYATGLASTVTGRLRADLHELLALLEGDEITAQNALASRPDLVDRARGLLSLAYRRCDDARSARHAERNT